MSGVWCLNSNSNLWSLAVRQEVCYIKSTRPADRRFRVNLVFTGGKSMFDVTQKATEVIKEALKDQEKISPVRVVYNEGG